MARNSITGEADVIDLVSDDEVQTRPSERKPPEVIDLLSDDEEVVLSLVKPKSVLTQKKLTKPEKILLTPKSTCATSGCKNNPARSMAGNEPLCTRCRLETRYQGYNKAAAEVDPFTSPLRKIEKLTEISIQSDPVEKGRKRDFAKSFEIRDSDHLSSVRPAKRAKPGASIHSDPLNKSLHEQSRKQNHVSISKPSRNFDISESDDLKAIRPAKKTDSDPLERDTNRTHNSNPSKTSAKGELDDLGAIPLAKRVKLGQSMISTTQATSVPNAFSVASSKVLYPKETIAKSNSASLCNDNLQQTSASKGKSKLVDNSTVSASSSTLDQTSELAPEKEVVHSLSEEIVNDIKDFPTMVQRERNNLIKTELDKSFPTNFDFPQQFIDKGSPWLSKLASIEIPGQSLDTAITSLTAPKKTSTVSVPFKETRCLVQKVPGFKNFEFIRKNVAAADSKILRFRRFDMFADPPARQAAEEKERYDIVLDPKAHMKAMRIAEDYASLYKHIPAILRALDCTSELLSESAKEVFAKTFKSFRPSSKLDLQTLVDCRGESFDCVDFLPDCKAEDIDSVQDSQEQSQVRNSWDKILEPLSSHWQLCCPICQVYQCGNHGEPLDESGDLNDDLSFKMHGEVLSSKQESKTKMTVFDPENECSSKCYRSHLTTKTEPAPWTPKELDLLGALVSMTEISPCLLRTALNKDCYDVHKRLLAFQKEQPLSLSSIGQDQDEVPVTLSWYDNKNKVLKWKNPAESRKTTKDTSIHKHAEMPKIKPCSHLGPCSESEGGCHPGGLCNHLCLCPEDCHLRFTGCNCDGPCDTDKCPCNALGFECNPDTCKSCGSEVTAHPRYKHSKLEESDLCQNVALQRAATPCVAIGESTFEGWGYGLFAVEDIPKGTFIGEYCGEIVSNEEAERRGIVYEEYFFTLSSETSIDATRKGNHMRFVNGTFPGDKFENCQPKILSVLGEHRIAFYASKTIKAGSEIFMDYGADYEKKHKLHFRERRENPKAWFFGNREGQISIVVDDNTPIPLIEQQLTIRSVSPESPPTRFGIRSGRRTLRSRRSLAKEDSDDNDDNDTIEEENRELPPAPPPIDKESDAYKALSISEKHSLWSNYRWAMERSKGNHGGNGKGKGESKSLKISTTANVKSSSKNRTVLNSTDQSSSSEEDNEEDKSDEEEDDEGDSRPIRTKRVPLQYTRYYG